MWPCGSAEGGARHPVKAKMKRYASGFGARQRARGRLPVSLGIVMPFTFLTCVFGLTFLSAYGWIELHLALHPGVTFRTLSGFPFALMTFPMFVGCVGPGGILANVILYLIPFVRRPLDENAKGVPGASFRAGVSALARVTKYALPIALILGLVGAVSPWSS